MFQARQQQVTCLLEHLSATRHDGRSLAEWLRRPEVTLTSLASMGIEVWPPSTTICRQSVEQVEIAIKYAGYLEREKRHIEKFSELERWKIPAGFDYRAVPHLRFEAREKLLAHHPISLGQALRISGITPADVTVLMVHLEALRRGAKSV